ncbi:unnamed protein product [Bursaphelenchus xylophilus]|uniref:(pine wood nematode) hypothetical protein n=1 Tax=Bursaphelenchus xylophilus TaxID=6326 RepID=A0A1I7SEX9_BURXY|nr:unnamed protein product [Bursaphelenchus xylophilus]CAG9113720.1 unnamed protein product [Bursaphelenchus xylophilus]
MEKKFHHQRRRQTNNYDNKNNTNNKNNKPAAWTAGVRERPARLAEPGRATGRPLPPGLRGSESAVRPANLSLEDVLSESISSDTTLHSVDHRRELHSHRSSILATFAHHALGRIIRIGFSNFSLVGFVQPILGTP